MIRLLSFAVVAISLVYFSPGHVFAGDYYSSVPFLGSVKTGPGSTGAIPVEKVPGKEYSDSVDVDAFGALDPAQVISWDGVRHPATLNSGSVDSFDYNVPGLPTFIQNPQVDALANNADALFNLVVRNEATLIFSVTGDSFAPGRWAGLGPGARVHWEDSTGGHAPWALVEAPPAGPPGGMGPGVNHHLVRDLDALEVWGPEPPSHSGGVTPVVEGYAPFATADSNRFSLAMDSSTGTSVWNYDIGTKTVSPYVPHHVIVAAVESLMLGAGVTFTQETRNQIDLDALMVRDFDAPGLWSVGDELLFSIRPLIMPEIVGAAGPLPSPVVPDGGEIMHLVNLGPLLGFSASFLSHGGHLWNTAFDVMGTFGYTHENVDGIEAIGALEGPNDTTVPEPSSVVLMGIGLLVGCVWRRRRS